MLHLNYITHLLDVRRFAIFTLDLMYVHVL